MEGNREQHVLAINKMVKEKNTITTVIIVLKNKRTSNKEDAGLKGDPLSKYDDRDQKRRLDDQKSYDPSFLRERERWR